MKSCFRKASLVGLLLLGGCMATAPHGPVTRMHPLERNAINALSHRRPDQADGDLDMALAQYEQLDDLYGQWRVHSLKARIALAAGDIEAARRDANAMAAIAPQIEGHDLRYRTSLMQGRVTGERADFESALSLAGTNLEKAVAQTYLGDTAQAIAHIDTAPRIIRRIVPSSSTVAHVTRAMRH